MLSAAYPASHCLLVEQKRKLEPMNSSAPACGLGRQACCLVDRTAPGQGIWADRVAKLRAIDKVDDLTLRLEPIDLEQVPIGCSAETAVWR